MSEDLEKQQHVPCPHCGSSDAASHHKDGWMHCFSCGKNWKEGNFEVSKKEVKKGMPTLEEYIVPIKSRGFTQETCEFWGTTVAEYGEEMCIVFNHFNEKKEVVGRQIRTPDKDFYSFGTLGLYGKHLWQPNGKALIITEGPADAMAVSQINNYKFPVVSIPNGVQSAEKIFKQELKWIESFEQVVLMFDNDEVGIEAAQKCAAILTPGKVKIAKLPLKDANDMLLAGRGEEVTKSFWSAETYQLAGIVTIEDVKDLVLSKPEYGIPWPWPSLTRFTYGRRKHEIYGFGGGTGSGKSDFLTQVMAQTAGELNEKIGIISLEQTVEETVKRLAGKFKKKFFHLPDHEYDPSVLEKAMKDLQKNVVLYDHYGCSDWESIKNIIRYFAVGHDCKHIFVDNLTSISSKEQSRLEQLRTIMLGLVECAQRFDITLYYVSHLSTPAGTPHEEGGPVSASQFYGSRDIARCSNYLFGIERNQLAEDESERHKSKMKVLKARYAGHLNGNTLNLTYDIKTGMLNEDNERVVEREEIRETAF